jgi:hypothetical protein
VFYDEIERKISARRELLASNQARALKAFEEKMAYERDIKVARRNKAFST